MVSGGMRLGVGAHAIHHAQRVLYVSLTLRPSATQQPVKILVIN